VYAVTKEQKLEQLKDRFKQETGVDYSKDIKRFVLWVAGLLMDCEGDIIQKTLESASIVNQPLGMMVDIKKNLEHD
jgi:hypothetical protein